MRYPRVTLDEIRKRHAELVILPDEPQVFSAEHEAAFRDAKGAQQAIDDAYQGAKALAERIRLAGSIAQSIGSLVRKAAGA